MDSEEVDCSLSSDKPITLEDHLDKLCSYYMSVGVPYDVFWYGDYCCLKYYEEAYMNRRKIQNENMWLMGMYNYSAHSTTLANAFRGKGQQAQEYMKKPMDCFPKTEEELEAEKEQMRRRVIENLNAVKREWDRKDGSTKDSGT